MVRDLSDQLRTAHANRRVIAAAIRSRAEDRRSIAAELHDGPVQLLAAVSLEMGLLRRSVNEEQRARLVSMERRIGESVDQLRALIASVAPAAVTLNGITPTVQEIYEEAGLGMPNSLSVELPPAIDQFSLAVLVEGIRAIAAAVPRTPQALRLETDADAAALRVGYWPGELDELRGQCGLERLTAELEALGGIVSCTDESIEMLLAGAAFDEGCAMSAYTATGTRLEGRAG